MPRTYGKPKQTRLSFNLVGSTSQDTQGSPGSCQAKLRYGHPSMPAVRSERTRIDFKKQGNQKSQKQRPSLPPTAEAASSDTEGQPVHSGKEPLRFASSCDNKKKRKPAQRSDKAIAVDGDSDSDLEIAHTRRTRNGARSLKRKRSAESEQESRSQSQSEEESDAQEVVSRPRRKLRRGAASKPTIVLDDGEDEDDSRGSNKKQEEKEKDEGEDDEDEDEDEDEPVVTPAQRRRRNVDSENPQTPRRGSDQDRIDIEEDLEDLQDSVVKETRTRGRLANSERSKRQQHLEILRRRRAGDKLEDISKSESEPEEQEEEEEEEKSETPEENQSPINYQTRLRAQEDSDVESAIAGNEDLDRYDDDFVLEDEEDPLGVPTGLEDMPFEFTRHAYKQTKEYFRDTVEWMVYNQLNPVFPRSAAMYQAAFSKVEDEVKGRTGSQIISSVWNVDFHRALMTRPHIEITAYPIRDNHPCDACNRSGHPASFDVKLYGKAYSMDTLEALDDDEDEDKEETDRDGNVLPSENTRFLMGRTCKARTEMAHTLIHWRYHLNEWVVDYLDRKGYLSDDKILERNHWSQKRRAQYAAETVAMMDRTDEVKKLWRDFKINLDAARESMNKFGRF